MRTVVLELGRLQVHLFGLALVLGILSAALWSYVRKLQRWHPYPVLDLVLWAGLPALIGARLLFVLPDVAFFLRHPLEALRLSGGGLSFWGAVIGAMAGLALLSRRRGWSWAQLLDEVALVAPWVQVPAWLGSDVRGVPGGVPWAVMPQDSAVALHPLPAYGALAAFLLFLMIKRTGRHATRHGEVFVHYVVLQGIVLFVLESFRAAPMWGPLTVGAWLAVIATMAALAYGGRLYRQRRRLIEVSRRPLWLRLLLHLLLLAGIVSLYCLRVIVLGG